jgi:hypothetical protein
MTEVDLKTSQLPARSYDALIVTSYAVFSVVFLVVAHAGLTSPTAAPGGFAAMAALF